MSGARNIALPISSFLPNLGGAEVGLHNIACKLTERGYRPVVMAPAPHVNSLREKGWQLPYKVEPFPPKIWSVLQRMPWLGFWILDRFFARMQSRYRFDFWHCTVGYPTGVALVHFARKRNDIRYLIRCAGEDIQKDADIGYGARLDPEIDKIVHTYLSQAQVLTAISDSVADEYRAIGVPEDHIRHIPNGVDLARFTGNVDRRTVRARHGLDPDAMLFLSVGRNHPKKNYAGLLDATARLLADSNTQKAPFQLAIVGKYAGDLAGQVDALNLSKHVKLIDQIGDAHDGAGVPELPSRALVDLYLAADIFVFPSLIETFGIAIVEAMAAGLPVIVGDSPGCRDVVRKGRDGTLVDPREPDAIATVMSDFMTDGAKRASHAAKAKSRAQDFDWDRVVDQYIELYDRDIIAK